MRNTYGPQQSDTWLRNRTGRITASRMVDVCSYLQKRSGDKPVGASSGKRDTYRRELISERLTGRTADHYNNPWMQRGNDLENDARGYYEDALRVMCQPVNFVVHPLYNFTGASPDSLVGNDGMVEIKCLAPWNHIEVIELRDENPNDYIEPQRFAQVGWQLACGGKERRWSDLVHYCPDIQGCEPLRFVYERIGRDELQWTAGERNLTGEAVIDYFTEQVLKLNDEIEAFFARHGAKPIAPFPFEVIEEEAADEFAGLGLDEADLDYIYKEK